MNINTLKEINEQSELPFDLNKNQADDLTSHLQPLTSVFIKTDTRASTDEARRQVKEVCGSIPDLSRKRKCLDAAIDALVGDLVSILAAGREAYGYRSVGKPAFKDAMVTYGPFKKAVQGLKDAGLLIPVVGQRVPSSPEIVSTATRFYPTPKFKKLVRGHGIDPALVEDHFKRPPPDPSKNLVRLRSGSTKKNGTYGAKTRGKMLPVNRTHPRVGESQQKLEAYNRFMADQKVTPGAYRLLYRQFNEGGVAGYDYDKSGRLYDDGGDFQNLSKDKRLALQLNGEPVCEIDIASCHYTILHGILGIPFDNSFDHFQIDGADRDVVKRYVSQSLGSNSLINRWNDFDYRDGDDRDLIKGTEYQQIYPIREIKPIVLEALPVLARWPKLNRNWADFQFLDSEVMLQTIYELTTIHGVPALPVHDSVIVPISKRAFAEQVLADAFEARIGVRPRLTVNEPPRY